MLVRPTIARSSYRGISYQGDQVEGGKNQATWRSRQAMTIFKNPTCPVCTDEFPRTWTHSRNLRCQSCSAQLCRTGYFYLVFATGFLSGYFFGLFISNHLSIESFWIHALIILSAVCLSVDLTFRFASTLSIRLFSTKRNNQDSTTKQR